MNNGQLATKVSGDVAFLAKLTAGTILQVQISGKLGGTINGMPVSGSGQLEYTFRYGASAWELSADGLASGPALPAGPLVYVPANASGQLGILTTGTVVSSAPFTTTKDRYNFKLKGRVSPISVAVFDDAVTCNLTGVADCFFDCTTLTGADCQAQCETYKVINFSC